MCKIILLAILKDSTQIIGRPEEARRGEALVWFERPEDYHHSPHLKASVENLSGTRVSKNFLLGRKQRVMNECWTSIQQERSQIASAMTNNTGPNDTQKYSVLGTPGSGLCFELRITW